MRRSVLLLAGLGLLAGCNPASNGNGQALRKQEETRAAEVAKLSGWARVYGAPDATISGVNQFGFKAPAYAAKNGAFASESAPVTIANSFADKTNQVRFAATGAAADQIDAIRFTLDLPDQGHAETARKRAADLIRDFLFQAKIDAKPIHDQIAAGKPGKGELAGGAYEIAGDAKQIAVTFTRTGASAPANQTQGK